MEAQEYNRFYKSRNTKLVLVLSALHMPRAMYLFRQAGMNPVSAPANYMIKNSQHRKFLYWMPSETNHNKTSALMHEIAGISWSWLTYRKME